MKKSFQLALSALLLILAFAGRAPAGVSCSVPFNLTNGTTADASQVMANYNAILSCLANNTAESGANSSITSLLGLTTPLSPGQGGTQVYWGGTATGTNTIVVTTVSPTQFSLNPGVIVSFIAGGTNTGAATLTVNGTGAKGLVRHTPNGGAQLVGGELQTGKLITASYTGSQYVMIGEGPPPGQVIDYAGTSCPTGYLEANGSTTVSQTTYSDLFAVLGTTWGAAGGGNFTIPDLRGRSTFARDSGGSNRITVAGGNFDGTAIGNTGGQQNFTVDQAHITAFSLTVTDPGHNHSTNVHGANSNTANPSNTFPGIVAGFGGGNGTIYSTTSDGVSHFGSTFIANATTGITVASGGSGIPLPVLSNAAIVLKCIKG